MFVLNVMHKSKRARINVFLISNLKLFEQHNADNYPLLCTLVLISKGLWYVWPWRHAIHFVTKFRLFQEKNTSTLKLKIDMFNNIFFFFFVLKEHKGK